MEMTFRAQPRPVLWRQSAQQLNLRPFTGLLFYRSPSTRLSESRSWHIRYQANGVSRPFCATGDFSRKRQRKRSPRRSKGRTPVGFVPKAPVETGSPKRDKRNAEDSRTSVIPPELDSRAPDTGYSSSVDRETLKGSQVKRTGRKIEGAVDGKGRKSPSNKRAAIAGKKQLKEIEIESVSGFFGEGESNAGSGPVFHESELEAEDLFGEKGNSTMKIYRSNEGDVNVTESTSLGSELQGSATIISDKEGDGLDNVRKNLTLENDKNIQAENYVNGSEVLGSETRGSDIISDEKEVKDLVSVQEIMDYECMKSNKIVSETEMLESEKMGSETWVTNEDEVMDLMSTQEKIAIVNYESIESNNNVSETELRSDSMGSDTSIADEKEVMDLGSIQENLAVVSYPSFKCDSGDETMMLGSGTMGSDNVASLEKEVTDVVDSGQDNLDSVSCQSIESDKNVSKIESLGSETMGFNSVAFSEKEMKDLVIEGDLPLVSNVSIESGKYVTEIGLSGSETMGSIAVNGYQKEVKDLIIVQENLSLVSCESLEPNTNVTEIVSSGSDTLGSDRLAADEKEVALNGFDSAECNKNLTQTESPGSETTGSDTLQSHAQEVNETDVVGSETMGSDSLHSDDKDVNQTDVVGSETTGSDALHSDGKEVDETDVVGSETTGSDTLHSVGKEVDETDVVGSETTGSDALRSDDKEVNETDVVGSERKDAMTNDVKKRKESQKLDLEINGPTTKKVMADENFSKGNNLFIYPGPPRPDDDIEIVYNRSLSPLKNEPDVIIMGAFNDWRWRSFTLRLEKTHLNGDWWSCKIHVPKQAYNIDFVFFNGKDVYDNNNKNDFHITVEGGMAMSNFEDFLVEEKHRELEKLVKEQAERERKTAEQRQREEERAASATDLAQAKSAAGKKREKLKALMKKPIAPMENVCFVEPREFKGGDLIRLYYNKISGPLAQAKDVWIHGGHNCWEDGLSIVARLVKSEEEDGCWWYAEVAVPDQAFVLDWVFTDGPPRNASIYDNNNFQDYHSVVPRCIDELYWVEEEQRIYQKLQDERRARKDAICAKAERTARMKAETKEQTRKAFQLSQRHIVYTNPVDVQAGSDVTVYYNPSSTVLNGKPEIWFRCSFNRWTHRRGSLSPQRMVPAENGSHVKTTVKVPLDAYLMDFVFSERENGGAFDNKNDMDYHVPVFGGIAKEPPMHVVHIAVEMAPIAKVGGLGDVVTSLSRAVQDLKHHVDVVFPKYDCLNRSHVKDLHYQKSFLWGGTEIKVWFGKVEGLSVYFLEPQNGFFWTGSIYAGLNDGARFGFFCHAALEFLVQRGFHPDIIHCHDWTSAPVAWLHKEHYLQSSISNARVIFTIHNLEFGALFIGRAMAHADKATTVSGTYSKEVAGDPAIAPHLQKFHGILNGIDPDIWDPYNDKFIPVSYTSENVVEGKKAAKEILQQRLSLKKADLPLVGIISRLTHQKGINLIKHAIWHTLERGGQVVLLGSAPDPRIHRDFVNLSNQMHNLHCDRARLCLTYDEPLSHLIYAGADFILVPSIFEPCGLTQLVAMRYGSIPVVRKTGGLYDTVFDVDHDQERAKALGLEANGFNFEGADHAGVNYALDRAISAWYDDKDWLNSLRKRVMEQDWSWNRPALEYIELYYAAHKY